MKTENEKPSQDLVESKDDKCEKLPERIDSGTINAKHVKKINSDEFSTTEWKNIESNVVINDNGLHVSSN